jgi:putative FmdB family regulatory protein
MPTYSYKCTVCDTAFDIQQSFTDASLTECPTCEGKLRKLFSAVGVTFNGSGFYRNDSRKSENPASRKKTEKATSSAAATSGSSSSNSSSGSSGSSSNSSSSSGSSSGSSSSAPAAS